MEGQQRALHQLFRTVCLTLLLSSGWVARAFESDEFDVEVSPDRDTPAAAQVSWPASNGADNTAGGAFSSHSEKVVTFPVEHDAFSEGAFAKCGEITAKYKTAGEKRKLLRPRLKRLELSAVERAAFQALVERDGFYRIRMPANVFEPSPAAFVVASAPARCLAAAGLRERLELQTDLHGDVIGLAYTATGPCSRDKAVQPSDWTFTSTVVIKLPLQAPRLSSSVSSLDAMQPKGKKAPVKKPEGSVEEEGEEVEQPEKTFWQKYWMYILPAGFIVLQMMTAGVAEDPSQARRQGAGGRPGGAPAAGGAGRAQRR